MSQDDIREPEQADDRSLIERAAARLEKARQRTPRAAAASTSPADGGAPRVQIDLEALATQGYLTPHRMRSKLAEEMRLIKRAVVQTFWFQKVDHANLIMVSSALPGEGKSFVTLNLAISLACEVDFHVLLVDADFERPVVFDRLGIGPQPGLMDVLKDPGRDIGSVILRTNIERLSVIGPGSRDDMSSELLSSQRMQQLARELADRYPDRLIIFDTPPILSASEASVLAEHVGQVVFVVEADRTARDHVEEAIERLPPNVEVGIVLNKGLFQKSASYYSYYAYKGGDAGG
ncbi:MAG: chromosome partitioning ATPase [Alphaproteobacteria bacterium]|nr:MAG: chromosome partitioning ATPase [Alphaproteobacteria bacterium]